MSSRKVTHREQTPGIGRCGREGNTTTKPRQVTCKTCRKPPKQDYMRQADSLFSRLIRSRGTCEAATTGPACSGALQCAHIISRSYKSIRTDERNALCLCAAHHTYFTHRPLEWEDWVRESFGTLWDELRAEALSYRPVDWKAEVVRLSNSRRGS